MKTMYALMKKEWMEQIRSGRLAIMLLLFIGIGIMNPAIAKMTPWLLEQVSQDLIDMGLEVKTVVPSALDSWTQFFKNMPLGLIAFLLLQSAILTREYESGTWVLVLAKGCPRHTLLMAKAIILFTLWTLMYSLSFATTLAYNIYFWENAIMPGLLFGVFGLWLVGLVIILSIVLFSTMANTNSAVLLIMAAFALLMYGVTFFPKLAPFSPFHLLDVNALMQNSKNIEDYLWAIASSVAVIVLIFGISIPLIKHKEV